MRGCGVVLTLALLSSAAVGQQIEADAGAALGNATRGGQIVTLHYLLPGQNPYCLREVHDYALLAQAASDLPQVFITPDSEYNARRFASAISWEGLRSKPRLYVDAGGRVAEQLGLPSGLHVAGKVACKPAIVAFGTDGRELLRFVSKSESDRLPVKEFRARVADALLLPQGSRYPRGDAVADPLPVLFRDGLLRADLALTADQTTQLDAALSSLDEPLFRLRDRQFADREHYDQAWAMVDQFEKDVRAFLTAEQRVRLDQVLVQARGLDALLAPRLVTALTLTLEQVERIGTIREATRAGVRVLPSSQGAKTPTASRQTVSEYAANQRVRVMDALLAPQADQFRRMGGKGLDIGRVPARYARAPELRGVTQWLNGEAQTLAALKGRVVVLEFITVGCVNCVHNQPVVQRLVDRVKDQPVTMLAIHTPETEGERDVARVRQGLTDLAITCPVAIDNDKANWSAWGNDVWPAVYLIDKAGYVRYWRYGEMTWQGAKGDEVMAAHLDELLAER